MSLRHRLESQWEEYFRVKVRNSMGGMVVKLAPTEAGIPDRMVLLPGGRIYLVELKTDIGRLSAIQRSWHERARELGTRVAVVHGKDEIDAWVRLVGQELDPKPRKRSPKTQELEEVPA